LTLVRLCEEVKRHETHSYIGRIAWSMVIVAKAQLSCYSRLLTFLQNRHWHDQFRQHQDAGEDEDELAKTIG